MAPTLLATPLSKNTACNTLPPEGAVLAWGGPALRTMVPWH